MLRSVFCYWLFGSRGISLNAPHRTGTFCGRFVVRAARFGWKGSQWHVLARRERGRTSRNGVRRSNSLRALGPYAAIRESCPHVRDLCPRVIGSHSRNTLRGSDSKHSAASSSWRLLWIYWYMRDKWQQERPISLWDSFIIHFRSLLREAETPPCTRLTKTWHQMLHDTQR